MIKMDAVFFMYERISAVRQNGKHTEIIHRITDIKPRRKIFGERLSREKDVHDTAENYESIRSVFVRDCTLLSPKQYIEDRFIPTGRTIFLEFQSMDSVHEGEMVLVNPSDIISYGGTTNDGGVHIMLSSGLLFLVPVSLQAFAHAHERHRSQGRITPTSKQVA